MKNEIIHHYFHKGNLFSILQKNGIVLWFTRFDCLNDYTEGKEATRIQSVVCEKLIKKHPDKERIINEIKTIKPNFKKIIVPDQVYGKLNLNTDSDDGTIKASASINIHEVKTTPYICCFSKKSDSLPIWKCYSKGNIEEGLNIGIENYKLVAELLNEKNIPIYNPTRSLICYDVIYDDHEKERLIKKEILKILKKTKTHNQKDEFEKELINYQYNLNGWSLAFKNNCFKFEEEVRMVCYCADEKIEDQNLNECFITYRKDHEMKKYYLKLLLPLKDKLKKIIIAPTSEIKSQSIRTFLEDNSYKNVEIEDSNIPIR